MGPGADVIATDENLPVRPGRKSVSSGRQLMGELSQVVWISPLQMTRMLPSSLAIGC